MAFAYPVSSMSVTVQSPSSSGCCKHYLSAQPLSTSLILPRQRLSCAIIVFSHPRNPTSSITAKTSAKKRNKNKKNSLHDNADEGGEIEEDAFELLFKQLEEDLKNDNGSLDGGDDEISEEDIGKLERELEDALGDDDIATFSSAIKGSENDDNVEVDDEDEDEHRILNLKNWQLRRLAVALKAGRRKTSIKNLAAELCLERAFVLELLRDPPPNLLMMSLSCPDEPASPVSDPDTKPASNNYEETSVDPGTNVPVHVMQHRWHAQKRLKKVQVDTLERVYKRTKRPTNAMISSIVLVTKLPRRRILKWFEDKRAEDGVPYSRIPYRRSIPETL